MRTFPSWPLREVRVSWVRQNCCGVFAVATVDVEPGPPGFAVAVAGGAVRDPDAHRETAPVFTAALAEGFRAELAARCPRVPLAVTVVVRELVIHPVDSTEHAFRTAGRCAAAEALDRLHGAAPTPVRRAPGRTSTKG